MALCWLAPAALGQVPYLVKDLVPGVDASTGLSASQFLALPGGAVLFANSNEVWATDGTPAGTKQLAVLPCLGCGFISFVATLEGIAFFFDGPNSDGLLWRTDGTRAGTYALATGGQPFVVAGGHLYFGGCAQGACGLLRSNGTAAGTTLVTPVPPASLAAAGSELFFFGPAAGAGSTLGLWKSDGTAGGTHLVKDFGARAPQILTILTGVADRVVFIAAQDASEQLWASDGTAAGTLPLTHFTTTIAFPNPLLKPAGAQAYFVANDGTHGSQVWRTDGTAAGTVPLAALAPPEAQFAALERSQLEVVGGNVVFVGVVEGGAAPWVISGTPAAAQPLCGTACRSTNMALVKAAGRLFFISLDAAPFGSGTATLWVTDGTVAGTHAVKQVCAGGCEVYSSLGLAGLPDAAYFAAGVQPFPEPPVSPATQLWASDGSAAGTRLVFAHAPAFESLFDQVTAQQPVFAQPLASFGAHLYFAAPDDSGGGQIWTSDGTPGGARQLTDAALPNSSFPLSPVAAGDRLFFLAAAPGGPLWQSDGTTAGTLAVPGVMPSFSNGLGAVTQLTAAGGRVFYLQPNASSGLQLWRADGTATGTLQLTAFPGGDFSQRLAATADGEVFFAFHEGSSAPGGPPPGIWKSDGTPQGTVKVVDLAQGYLLPAALTAVGGDLYFIAARRQGATAEIWKSDGTPAGTVRLQTSATTLPLNLTFDPGFTALGSRVVFSWPDPAAALWVTDGTPAGTVPVAAPPAGPGGPYGFTPMAGVLYMLDASNSLWRTDGTAAGTTQVTPQCCLSGKPVVAGEKLFFGVGGVIGGPRLWSSDGTAAGTAPVSPAAGLPLNFGPLAAAGGRVFFAADDRAHGVELWQSDGTAQGTRMVGDIAPGLASSHPAGMTQAGDQLYFSADDGLSGNELWSLPLAAGPACQPSDAWLCLLGRRFRVEAAWRDGQGHSGAGHAVALTADTGWFWFFGPDNVEVVLKVLDGRPINGHVWVFYGALSNVEYTLTVTDTQTGITRRYDNPPGQLASVADTHAFGPMGAFSAPGSPSAGAASPRASAGPAAIAADSRRRGDRVRTAAGPGSAPGPGAERASNQAAACQPSAGQLCLNGGRFAVKVSWQDFSGRQGRGIAVPLTADTGTFWFFNPANVELVVKVLDGRASNGHFWVFYGALSNVAYTVTVTDTVTGAVRTYRNPSGRLASFADTAAF